MHMMVVILQNQWQRDFDDVGTQKQSVLSDLDL